ncbi:MAG: hypothetical protein ACOYNZ_01265 [Rhodoferax sp.]
MATPLSRLLLVPAARALRPFAIGLRASYRLPLHVAWRIKAAACERIDVLNHVTLARPFAGTVDRAWVLSPELILDHILDRRLDLTLGTIAALAFGFGFCVSKAASQGKQKYKNQGVFHLAILNRALTGQYPPNGVLRRRQAKQAVGVDSAGPNN